MKHKEFRKVVNESNVAFLFIHGILGTPDHFKDFIENIPENCSIYNILLSGHGKSVDDFSKTTMLDWKKQVENELYEITQLHNEVYIVAHSMGCLFAINLAIKETKVRALFLLAPPINPTLKLDIIATAYKMIFGKYKENDFVTLATKRAYGLEIDKRLSKYLKWIPNYISLFKEINKTKKNLKYLKTRTMVFFGKKDELVLLSSKNSFDKVLSSKTFVLENTRHFYYDEKDYQFLLDKFSFFAKK